MALALYIKEDTAKKIRIARRRERGFFAFISAVGISAIVFSVFPYVAWQIKTLPRLTAKVEEIPIPQAQVLSSSIVLNNQVQVVQEPDGFTYFSTDYKPQGPRPKQFTVTIPRLKIKNAIAKVDNLNFYDNLSHFPGSALPGEVGNSFITGHSALPQFNDPQNYKTIFTKLSDLEVGDDVIVEMEGQIFQYVVQYSKVVDPHDTSVLAPISANGRNLTLMTCVPPGTSTKRLVVIASLI